MDFDWTAGVNKHGLMPQFWHVYLAFRWIWSKVGNHEETRKTHAKPMPKQLKFITNHWAIVLRGSLLSLCGMDGTDRTGRTRRARRTDGADIQKQAGRMWQTGRKDGMGGWDEWMGQAEGADRRPPFTAGRDSASAMRVNATICGLSLYIYIYICIYVYHWCCSNREK